MSAIWRAPHPHPSARHDQFSREGIKTTGLFVNREKTSKSAFAECTRIIESLVPVQGMDAFHFRLREFKASQINILPKSFQFARFWDDSRTSLHTPAKHDLGGRSTMVTRDLLNYWVIQNGLAFACHTQRNVGRCTQGRKGGDRNGSFVAKSNKLLLYQIGV